MFGRVLIAGIPILLAAAWAAAIPPSAVDGRWQCTICYQGCSTISFVFKADGTKLTGTISTPDGDKPIDHGRIEGDAISYQTHLYDTAVDYQGTVSGDTIQLKINGPVSESDPHGQAVPHSEMTLMRVAEKTKSEK